MNEFKLNMFFIMYKDKALPNRDEFRKNFKKKYGQYQYLEELIRMIEQYQFKKYGQTLNNFIKKEVKKRLLLYNINVMLEKKEGWENEKKDI